MGIRIGKEFWLILTIASVIFFFNLGGIPLLDPDEPVYAETPKEMYQFNEFVSPRIYGEYWYDKPPMYYWLVAGSYQLFGVNEFSARFPSALLGVFCVLSVYWFARSLFNERTALWSSLILATSIEYFYLAKAAVTDITLTLFLTLCLLSFLKQHYRMVYIFAGLATLTKGPVGLLFPGGIILLYLLATNNLKKIMNIKLPSGLLLYALVSVPWYWLMYNIHGQIFIDTFLGFHNITRFTSPEHPEGVLWYYYIPVLILGFFPWITILCQSVWTSLTKSTKDFYPLLFLNVWAAFIFLFFTVSRTKLVSYILPMFPPLAIIAGWYIDFICSQYRRNQGHYAWILTLGVVTLAFIAGMFMGLESFPVLQTGVYWSSGIFLLMLCAVGYFLLKKQIQRAAATQVFGMLLFSMVLVGMMFPAIAPYFASKDLAQQFSANYDGSAKVYITKFLHPGFTFYSNIYGTEVKGDHEILTALENKEKAYFVLRKSEYNRVIEKYPALKPLWEFDDKILLLKETK